MSCAAGGRDGPARRGCSERPALEGLSSPWLTAKAPSPAADGPRPPLGQAPRVLSHGRGEPLQPQDERQLVSRNPARAITLRKRRRDGIVLSDPTLSF